MSKLTGTIRKARKLVKELDKLKNVNSNQLFVCTEYNAELSGELVIILKEPDPEPSN